MNFTEYQRKARSFVVYPEEKKITYPTLGLCGEAGEIANKVKKQIRDNKFDRHETAKELGDVLWYVAVLANDLGYSLVEIAENNIEKLESRQERGVIQGSGDNR